jgi:hypothetical protein
VVRQASAQQAQIRATQMHAWQFDTSRLLNTWATKHMRCDCAVASTTSDDSIR